MENQVGAETIPATSGTREELGVSVLLVMLLGDFLLADLFLNVTG